MTRGWGLVARGIVVALMCATGAGAAPPAATSAPPQAEVVKVTDDRLTISVPKWTGKGYEENIGLDVRFRWTEDAAWRSVAGKDAGTDWLVVFPDRPETGAPKAQLELVYRFTLSDVARERLLKAADEATLAMIDGVVQALKAADAAAAAQGAAPGAADQAFAAAMDAQLAQLPPAFSELDAFTTAEQEPAKDVILQKLGFTQDAAKAWHLTRNSLHAMSDVEGLALSLKATEQGLARVAAATLPPTDARATYGDGCRAALQPLWGNPATQAALAGIDACGAALAAAKPATSASITLLRSAAKRVADASYSDLAQLNGDTSALRAAAGDTVLAVPAGERAALVQDDAFEALGYSIQALAMARMTELKEARMAELTLSVVEQRLTLRRDETASALLRLEARRRMYDTVTGLVYVAGLDDVVIPTLLSICPWGCLKTDKGTSDYFTSSHVWSVDFGVKVATLDAKVDPRHDGAIGLLIGASYNPIDVVRVSAGAYVFENAQTNAWNATAYAGISVNVLHAAELLGVLGIKRIPEAAILPQKPEGTP